MDDGISLRPIYLGRKTFAGYLGRYLLLQVVANLIRTLYRHLKT